MRVCDVHSIFFSFICAALGTVLVLSTLSIGFAQVRSSASYQLQSDSINIGGGLGTSSSFQLDSTVGEVATGRSTSSNFSLQAGFQQMQTTFISVSVPTDVVMTPNLPGITGGTSTGSTTVTVITDNPGGYELSIVSDASPAMRSGPLSIADYEPVGAVPDFTFVVPNATGSFAFSPAGLDRSQRYRSSGGVCGVGSDSIPERCWDGLSTTSQTIALGSGANHPDGTETTVYFQVGIGSGATVPPATYVATTTLSVIAL
jgi:hypothetical protein